MFASLEHVYEILRSAKALRTQFLDLDMFQCFYEMTTIAQRLLESTVSNNITNLTLSMARVEEEVLLKALSRWAPRLHTLSLWQTRLHSKQKGWTIVMHTLATMPRLKSLKLGVLSEQHGAPWDSIWMSLDRETSTLLQPGGVRKYAGRNAVSMGLEELLAGSLPYVDSHNIDVGCRNSDGYLMLM